jgi:predicted nucleic acid-binding protein
MILPDTSFLIAQQRMGVDVREGLYPWVVRGDILFCGIVGAEFLRGIRDNEMRDLLRQFFGMIPHVPMEADFWAGVADLAVLMDRAGQPITLTDLAIAESCRRSNAILITLDAQFRKIPGLKHRKHLPPWP